ncbi:hypothetical protein RUM43_015024 [Polyplax serrata]
MIDDKIQEITRVVFRVVGRAVLSGGGLGGSRQSGNNKGNDDDDSSRRISVVLPTYPPDEDEEEEEAEDATESATLENSTGSEGSKDNLISPEDDSSKETKKKRSGSEESNVLTETQNKEVRVPFVQSENDLQAAATGDDNENAESSQEELSEDIEISNTDENSRSKRLGVFGNLFGGGGDSGSEGGSGNFLFDIIRRTADGAARAAGTVYRLVAGTAPNTGLNGYSDEEISGPYGYKPFSALAAQPSVTSDITGPADTTLVAGSGATEQEDENSNVPGDQGHSIDDGYQTGIPGPITRLFVIANRGIANLVQDLILRLAQTSERLVNFKARLITAII